MTVLINNAGGLPQTASMLEVTDADLRQVREINFFAPLAVARAFAPILTSARNAVLIDMHSVASWYFRGGAPTIDADTDADAIMMGAALSRLAVERAARDPTSSDEGG